MPARDRRAARRGLARSAPRPALGGPFDARSSDTGPSDPRRSAAPLDQPGEYRLLGGRGTERTGHPEDGAERLSTSTVLTRALLPLRLFFGGTFLYAGIDKLVDPTFLRASGVGSIGEQIQAFEKVSPIAALVHLGDPFPVVIGILIALLEIAIGLGALLGLLFRWAALAGAGLAFLFFLTASWATHPYYYGPDLPYAFGWLTLALAGHGHLFTLEDWLARRDAARASAAAAWSPRGGLPVSVRHQSSVPPMFTDQERRAFLQLGLLAFASVAVASITGIWGLGRRGEVGEGLLTGSAAPSSGAGASPSAANVASATPSAGSSAAPSAGSSAAASPGADLIGTLADVKAQGALMFQDPTTGDPAILVSVGSSAAAYDAVCTHAGCTVEYDPNARLLFCPCHGAEFDPANDAAVVAGPAPTPLAKLPIKIDGSTGKVYLTA